MFTGGHLHDPSPSPRTDRRRLGHSGEVSDGQKHQQWQQQPQLEKRGRAMCSGSTRTKWQDDSGLSIPEAHPWGMRIEINSPV